MPTAEKLRQTELTAGATDRQEWVGNFGVALPCGARMHPETIDRVRTVLGRVAGIRPLPDGFDVFCVLSGDSQPAVQADVDQLISTVLGSLALPAESLRYCELISPEALAPLGTQPSLRLV